MAGSTKTIKNVVFSIAMEAEARPFIEYLKLEQDKDFFPATAPFLAYKGIHESCNIVVVTAGKDTVHGTGVDNVATVPAAVSTYLTLHKLMQGDGDGVDLLINAGTAGGFKAQGAGIGDVYLTTAVAHHDRRIPIPGFDTYGMGKLNSHSTDKLADLLGAKQGVCTTGNSLDYHDLDEKHMKENGAVVKDMEAAAIAWSCAIHSVPTFGVKVVTDIVDGDKPTQEEFFENLESAAKSLQEALPKVVEYVCGKSHDEL